jgi:tetratricopeptide (TPR) repeat protein
MAKGYKSRQTDLPKVLDTGTFNCVSSATLYNALALRLGLDVRAIEVPDHAFSILYDGTKHMDVETTTPQGFDPARDKAAVAEFEATTGFRYIADAHRDRRREIEESGLVAITYYNHGVALGQEKRYGEALLAYFRAMSLDAEFASAVKNALAVLANWGVELARSGRHEVALDVVTTGLALAPTDAALVNNHRAIWGQWVEGAIDAGRADEALALLARAAAAVPDGGFAEMQPWVYLKGAEQKARAGKWEDALAAAAPGLDRLTDAPREELASWRLGLYLRWFTAEVRAGRFAEAAVVLEQGRAAAPGDARFLRNAGYLAQEWSKTVEKESPAKALEVLRTLATRFAGVKPVADAAVNHVRRRTAGLLKDDRFEEALASLAEAAEFLGEKDLREGEVHVFDTWAKERMGAGAFSAAADVYTRALQAVPESALLKNNLVFLVQQWAVEAERRGGAPAAIEALREARKRFPDLAPLGGVVKSRLAAAARALSEAGKPEEALALVESGKDLVAKESDARDLAVGVWDAWARRAAREKDWEAATAIYGRALTALPKESRLRGNAVATWDEWAKTFTAVKDWDGALGVYDRALAALPESSLLKNNRKWAAEQKAK